MSQQCYFRFGVILRKLLNQIKQVKQLDFSFDSNLMELIVMMLNVIFSNDILDLTTA